MDIYFYIDASGNGVGLCITQYRKAADALIIVAGKEKQLVEVSILYDSFIFSATQKLYSTYKKELCALVKFCIKYDYLCKHPYYVTMIHTDHRPLVHFLKSDTHEGIYGHWADKLRRLNIQISYIPGPRNKVADGLSRTLFASDSNENVNSCRKLLADTGSVWIWKDGKDGFEAFLKALDG